MGEWVEIDISAQVYKRKYPGPKLDWVLCYMPGKPPFVAKTAVRFTRPCWVSLENETVIDINAVTHWAEIKTPKGD